MGLNITLSFIVLCFLIFIVQNVVVNFTDYFILSATELASKPWIVLTSVFLHGSISHLIFNMLALFMFGLLLEEKTSREFFTMVFVTSGLIGSLGFLYFAASPESSGLGASGAIYGLIGALVVLEPKIVVFVQGIPMPMYIAGPIYALVELFGLGLPDNIAHSAHLFGFLGGFFLSLAWKFDFIKKFRTLDYFFIAVIAVLISILVALVVR